MTERELALRREIFEAFAGTGAPPVVEDLETLRSLAEQHVVVLDDQDRVVMAHPFSIEREHATRVQAGDRTWYGSCAWDGLGLVAALGLDDAVVESQGVTVGEARFFHVLVPARDWWDDPGYT